MYRLWSNKLSHSYFYDNPILKRLAEKKYDYLVYLNKDRDFQYTFRYEDYVIYLKRTNGVGKAFYSYEPKAIAVKEEKKKDILYGLLSLITTPIFKYNEFYDKIVPVIHNNIIDLNIYKDRHFFQITPFTFNGNFGLPIEKEIVSFEKGYFKPTGMLYFTYFDTEETEFPDPEIGSSYNFIQYKKRKIYDQYSVNTKCNSWNNPAVIHSPECGHYTSSYGSNCSYRLCDDFNLASCKNMSKTEGWTVYSPNDGGCAWRFGHSFTTSNSCSLNFIEEWLQGLNSKCPNENPKAFWDTVSYEYVIPFLKTETLHQESYRGETWNHERKSKDETTYRIMLGNRLLKKGYYTHNYIGNDFFTDCEWSEAVCRHHGLTPTDFFGCLGGNAPSVYYSVSETRNKLVTEENTINPYYWDIFLPKNIKKTNNPKYYAIIYTTEDNNSESLANPEAHCMDCSKGYFPFLGSGLCCNDSGCFTDPESNPDVKKYSVPTMEDFESSTWAGSVKSFSHTEYATYLNIDGKEIEIARGTFAWCGGRLNKYMKIINGDYIYESYFKNIGNYIFLCMQLAYGVCDFIFRDTPFIEYYDLSNTVYKDRFEALLLYSYIVIKANGCDETKDELKKYVLGYKLYHKEDSQDQKEDVYLEQEYHPLKDKPVAKFKVLEGTGGEMNRNAGDVHWFYIQASNPFYNSDVLKFKVNDEKLDKPNGGIEIEIDWDYIHKFADEPDLITSYNIYVLNLNSVGVLEDENNPFKLIAVVPNNYKEDTQNKNKVIFRTTKLYPDSFNGEATNIYRYFMLGSNNWKPIRVLDTLSERLN